jgi:E3 ubiquitin-protein ligase HERC3
LLDDGTVKCWGGTEQGDLGLGDTETRGDEPSEMGEALPAVDLRGTSAIESISAATSTCALFVSGQIQCWGPNASGNLGLGDEQTRGDGPGEMGGVLPFIDLGPGARVVAVAAGRSHSCAVLDNGKAKCWGRNQFGGLGLGDTDSRGDQPGEMGQGLPTIDLW